MRFNNVRTGSRKRAFCETGSMDAKIAFSPKKLRKSNNDTIYFDTAFQYKVDGEWKEMEIGIRARGNFRRATCYYPPVKVDLKEEANQRNRF